MTALHIARRAICQIGNSAALAWAVTRPLRWFVIDVCAFIWAVLSIALTSIMCLSFVI